VAYSTRSIGLMEKAILENGSVSVMEASIIPTSLKVIDGREGFPSLPDVAISIHRSTNNEAHVSLVADYLLSKLAAAPSKDT
jgi:hypothetical protein